MTWWVAWQVMGSSNRLTDTLFDPHDPVFAIVDTETTGMSKTARIVELGVVILNAEFEEVHPD